MVRTRIRRHVLYTLVFLAGLLAYAIAMQFAPLVAPLAVLLALAAATSHVLSGDEVERSLAYRAGALAFLVFLLAATAVAFFDASGWAAAYVEFLWFAMMLVWMTAWTVLRMRQW